MKPQPLAIKIAENPFYVLGLPSTCTRQEVEREGQKWLSMLALSLKEAAFYVTPLGEQQRTPELVRQAMADLRDPQKRLVHELLATLPAQVIEVENTPLDAPRDRWASALSVLGLGPPRKPAGPR